MYSLCMFIYSVALHEAFTSLCGFELVFDVLSFLPEDSLVFLLRQVW